MTINNALLRASAGTGKTFQLSNRYILLALRGTSPEQLLATTFTRKAAGEILERIFQRLAAATTSSVQAKKLSSELEIAATNSREFGEALTFLTTRLHRINVSTLDSYFAKLLTNHAYEFELGTDWSIATSGEQASQKHKAIIELLGSLSATDSSNLMRFINKGKYNRSILNSLDQTITSLISPFYQSPAEAWKCDLQSKTSAELLPAEQISLAISQIEEQSRNELCTPFSKTITSDLVPLRANDWESAIKGGLFKKILAGDHTFSRKPLPDALVAAYLPLTKHVVALKILELKNQTQATFSILTQYASILDRIKQKSKRLEFNDVTRILSRSGGSFESPFRMDAKIEHLLLDEFQDTSLPQWNIVEPLAISLCHQPKSSFFCVGDVKQAIYGWRGGRREIFDRLESNLDDIEPDTLKESYRSSEVVVDFVNNIFNNLDRHPNPSVHAETLLRWQEEFEPLRPVLKHEGYVEYVNAEIGTDNQERLESCLALAVDKTETLLAANRQMEIGILVRTNASIAILINLLAARGIASSEDGGNPLGNYCAVQLILSALSLVEHPGNSVAEFHVSQSPLAGVFKCNTDTVQAVDASLEFRRRIAIEGFQSVLTSLVLVLEPHVDRVQFTRLEHLLVFADAFTFSINFRIDEFIEAVQKEQFSDPDASRVRVMTVHQSKGLEFDAVILPTLGSTLAPRTPTYAVARNARTQEITDVFMYRSAQFQQILPTHYREACASTVAESVNESLCVLYVALTRAARALYLIGPCQEKMPKLPPLTSGGVIQMAIVDEYSQTPNHVVYSNGNPNWFKELPDFSPNLSKSQETLPVPLAKQSTTELAPLVTSSPSALEGGERFLLSGVLRSVAEASLSFGTQLHFFMEQIDWARGTFWEVAMDAYTAKYGSVNSDLQIHLDRFVDDGPLAQVLTTDFYFTDASSPLNTIEGATPETTHFTVHNEFPICASVEGILLRGFIDRLIIMRVNDLVVAVDICDYKTDRVDEGTAEFMSSLSHYRPQIQAYKKAIAQMLALQPSQIGARLIFTHAAAQVAV